MIGQNRFFAVYEKKRYALLFFVLWTLSYEFPQSVLRGSERFSKLTWYDHGIAYYGGKGCMRGRKMTKSVKRDMDRTRRTDSAVNENIQKRSAAGNETSGLNGMLTVPDGPTRYDSINSPSTGCL